MSEMLNYQNDLTSMTQGRPIHHGVRPLRYVAAVAGEKIIAAARCPDRREEEKSRTKAKSKGKSQKCLGSCL